MLEVSILKVLALMRATSMFGHNVQGLWDKKRHTFKCWGDAQGSGPALEKLMRVRLANVSFGYSTEVKYVSV